MAVESFGNGGVMITGESDIRKARDLTLLKGLEFEVAHSGMQLSRGRSCSQIIKKEHGLSKGMRKSTLLVKFKEILREKHGEEFV
tara:strand:+ start:377 stop:631 length:255 start_codon:yes stop_codon:yes gene_type:complete